MKGWRALKRKASELPPLIDYSKKAFCRELCSFLNGLAVARLSPLCVSLVDGQTSITGLLRSPQAHFNLDVWTQQMAAFNFAFEVCLLEDYKKLCSSCWRTRASVCLGNNQSCWHLFGWVISTKKLANKLIVQMLLVNVYICTVFDLRLTKVGMKQCLTLRSFHFPLQRRCCALWCSHSVSEH